MDEQSTPERPEHEQPTGQQAAAPAQQQPQPGDAAPTAAPTAAQAAPVPADEQPTQTFPATGQPTQTFPAAAQPTQTFPAPGQPTQQLPPVAGAPQGHPRPTYVPPAYGQGTHPQAHAAHSAAAHQPMPAPWPPAAPYGAQQYGTHQYGAQFGGQPGGGQPGAGQPGQPGAGQAGAHTTGHRHGMSAGLVAGVTAGALAFGLVAGGGGVALFEYLQNGNDSASSTQNAAFDQGPASGSSGSDGSGSDGSGSDGSGSDGSGVSPFSGGDGSDGGSSGGFGQGLPGGGSDLGGQGGSQQTTTEPTSTQAQGVVLIDSVLGYQGAESAGTGMILTSDGLVLTNNHVVQGATSVSVTIGATGKTYNATVVGTDKSKDVALLQLKDASGLMTVTLDDDQGVTTGDDVTAVGNAQGGGSLVAAPGAVTATDQTMTASTESSDGSETLNGLIEFSAGVVSGDSGGPLLDSEGEVVGMTTAASSGGTSTVAYAIEITDALAIAHKIDQGQAGDGIVIGTPAFLGVAFTAGNTGSTSNGATVGQVLQGTPAAKAGIAAGDTITKVGSKAVDSADALSTALGKYAPGDKVKITWVSGTTGKTQSATVTLMAGPAA